MSTYNSDENSWIPKVSIIHPLGKLVACIKFYGNPFNICQDGSVWTKVVAETRLNTDTFSQGR